MVPVYFVESTAFVVAQDRSCGRTRSVHRFALQVTERGALRQLGEGKKDGFGY